MNYRQFMDTEYYKNLDGKEDSKVSGYHFPLRFDVSDELVEDIKNYAWLDDYLYEETSLMSQIVVANSSPMKILAVVDIGFEYEGSEDVYLSAFEEEFFLVDTDDPSNPVYLWGHETGDFPEKIHENFDYFF